MQKLRTGTRIVLLCSFTLLAASGSVACDGGGEPASSNGQAPGTESESSSPEGAGAGEAPAETDPAEAEDQAEPAGPAWTDEGFRTVFDFVANRHLAHLDDTGVFVDFGAPSGYKYIQGRWRSPWMAGRDEGGRRVAYTDGIGATFRLPLTEADLATPGDRELVLRMKAVGSDQRMDVFVNGDDALPTVMELPTDWDIVRIRVPRDRLRVGENMFRVHFARSAEASGIGRTAGGFDWARLQIPATDPSPAHAGGAFGRTETADGKAALAVPVYGQAAWYLTVPEQARLRLHAQVEVTDPAGEIPNVPTEVRLLVDGAGPVELWAGIVEVEPMPVEVDLSSWAGQAVRLELAGEFSVYDGHLLFVEPRLVVAEEAARPIGEMPRHVFVWLVDTLRSDYFTPYNPEAVAETPNLTAFAEGCQLFERHTVQGNSSLPASGSIHTSTYPTIHGINDGSTRIDRELTVLGQAVEGGGLDTSLFSSNGYVTESRGFGRGYDEYRNLIHEPGRSDSEYLWPIARDWLAERGEGSRWFSFLNTIDPHVPYDPPEDLLARYHPEPYTGSIRPRATGELLDGLGERGISEADLRYLLALHYGEITYNDVWFGQAIDDLRELGFLDDTLVVITSDHGEGFMDHGRAGHGTSVYEEVVSVPLLLCHSALGAGRIATEVESIDIYPTILDVFDIEPPSNVQGISLLPLVEDPTPRMNRPAFSYHQDFLRGLRLGRWKYHLRTGDNDNLYDLSESFIEGDDRREQAPIAYRHMRDVMAFHLAFDEAWHKAEWGFANNHSSAFAEQLDDAVW